VSATSALTRRALADSRTRNLSFAALFGLYTYASVAGYRSTYPTLRSRLEFAHAFGGNASLRLFYGKPYDLLSVGGYSAWRIGGLLSIFAAVWGVLAAVRALKTEEDSGRGELVFASPIGRIAPYRAALAASAAGVALLWLTVFLGLLGSSLPAAGSSYTALAAVVVAPVFVGVGALASQLASTRRIAIELSSAIVALALLIRVVADTASGMEWLRWATPLGWVEEMRPFTGPQPLVLLLPLAASAVLLTVAGRISLRRDVGSGLLASSDDARPRLWLLSSPTALALREERASLAAWLFGAGLYAVIVGAISTSVSSAGISNNLQRQLRKVAAVSITTPAGYIGLCFLFFILLVSLFACAQLTAARHEESQERLETLLALPVDRRRWLAGRLGLAIAGAVVISLSCGLLAWAGAASQNAHITLSSMLEAGANCLPVALLFLGLAALAFALLPRATTGLTYGFVAVTFVWQLLGSLLGAPKWLVEATPFAHVGFVPAQAIRMSDALVMLALAAAACGAALWAFGRRDLIGE
jgi:ABC-2 type transport system permease protein